jgi:hypothetical protein
MRSRRVLAALAASMVLIIFTGCGGDQKKESNSATSGAAARTNASNQANDKAGGKADDMAGDAAGAANSAGSRNASADTGAIDVSLAMPEQFAAIVINPRRIAASPLVAAALKNDAVAGAVKKFGIDPSEVEQIVILMGASELQPGRTEQAVIISTRFTHDVDSKDILTKLQAASSKGSQPIKEIQVAGKICLDDGKENGALAYSPNKNTIVMASKGAKSATGQMEKVLAATGPKGPLHDRLKKANTENDLIVVAEIEKFPDLDKIIEGSKAGGNPQLENYLDAVKKLRGATLGLNLTGDSLLQIVLETKDPAGTETIEGLLKDAIKMIDGGLAAVKQSVNKDAQAQYADAFKLGEQAVAGITVAKSGTEVTATMKRPASMDKIGSLVEKAIPAMMMGMGGGPMRPAVKPLPPEKTK